MMRMPIKIRLGVLPERCRTFLPMVASPISLVELATTDGALGHTGGRSWFSTHVSSFTSGTTCKSTSVNRHRLADQVILEACRDCRPSVLDIGVSDGVTSLELIDRLGDSFEQYFVADRQIDLLYRVKGNTAYFYDRNGLCILIATKRWVVYPQAGGWFPFGWIARGLSMRAPACDTGQVRVLSLMQPELVELTRRDPRIAIMTYDVLHSWPGPAVNIVKISNVLNPEYFPEALIRVALGNINAALEENGMLVVSDNRASGLECVSAFRKRGPGFALESMTNGGCRIQGIVLAKCMK